MGKEDTVLKSNRQRGLLYRGQTGRRTVGGYGGKGGEENLVQAQIIPDGS